MGTSSSYRSPDQPRWSAFVAALVSGASVDRVRSELFNAGAEWQAELSTPAIASFAETLIQLHADLPERLAQNDRSDVALGAVIAEARRASMGVGFSAANALAERAFARLLLETVQGGSDTPFETGKRWESGKGTVPSLVAKYLGELLGQYARHVTDREAGRLVESGMDIASSARVSDDLAVRASAIGEAVAGDLISSGSDVSASWAEIVRTAFEVGRALPRGGA